MIRRVTGKIGAHNINIKPFIFTKRCVCVLKKKDNISEMHGPSPAKSISNQEKEITSGSRLLTDSSFGKKSISNFFENFPAETRENFTENSTVPTNN
ncbi:MAG: hypothetical protein RLY40_835 [Pseudomonadota bacterium]|jgi:hypothetical protein